MWYIVNHKVVVRKIIALIYWSLVYSSLKLRNPVPQQVVGLEAINRDMQVHRRMPSSPFGLPSSMTYGRGPRPNGRT